MKFYILKVSTVMFNSSYQSYLIYLPALTKLLCLLPAKSSRNHEIWYLFAKPTDNNTNNMDFNRCDNYSTNLSGDIHCRGLCVTLNTTFTADIRCVPTFVCVYSLTALEMPGDEIIIIPIKDGCIIKSEQIYQGRLHFIYLG